MLTPKTWRLKRLLGTIGLIETWNLMRTWGEMMGTRLSEDIWPFFLKLYEPKSYVSYNSHDHQWGVKKIISTRDQHTKNDYSKISLTVCYVTQVKQQSHITFGPTHPLHVCSRLHSQVITTEQWPKSVKNTSQKKKHVLLQMNISRCCMQLNIIIFCEMIIFDNFWRHPSFECTPWSSPNCLPAEQNLCLELESPPKWWFPSLGHLTHLV